LWALARPLTAITTTKAATAWLSNLNDWHQVHGHLVRQRTYRNQVSKVPDWVRPGQKWWYTHDRLRKAYRLLEHLARDEQLFVYLEPAHEDLKVESTTNRIEGAVNAQLPRVLRDHPGMTSAHARRALEWWLYLHSEHPKPPSTLIRPEHYTPAPPKPPTPEPDGPALYDTAISAEEGLWTHKGWAGHS
jgi:hypothetical protein